MIKNNKKVFTAWAMYDWANSVYNLVITTTFFPVFYILSTQVAFGSHKVKFFGMNFINSALYDYTLALAYLLTAILSPILSSIADIKNKKLFFLKVFTYTGGISCILLFFFKGINIEWGICFFMLSTIGYTGGLVFINSYLPLIADNDKHDMLSAKGFMLGYIGSILLQILGFLLLIIKPFGISDALAIRITFLSVGVWWIGFAQIPFKALKPYIIEQKQQITNIWKNGFNHLFIVWKKLKTLPLMRTYLLAFFTYNMGVQTVMLIAINFGSKELGLSSTILISIAIIIQFVALIGAWLMAKLSQKYGNIKTLIITVLLWIGVAIGGYYVQTANQFYVLASIVGLVMGGIQSLSRSTFSKLIPSKKDSTSFFSFYDISEKIAIVIGLLSFGIMEEIFNSMRTSVLIVLLEFIIGLFLLILTSKISSRHIKI